MKEVSDDPTNGEWRQLFEKRLGKMKVLSSDIEAKILRELPDLVKDPNFCNFITEVNFFDRLYKDLVAENDKLQSAKKASNSYSNSGSSNNNNSANKNKDKVWDDTTGKSKNVSEIERIMKDVTYSVGKVQKSIATLKGLGFSLEGKISREAKDKADGVTTGDTDVSKDIASMSADELNGAIQKERDRIYKANVSMDGVSPAIVKYYAKTLTKSQKDLYQDLVRKYQNRSYQGEVANGMAIRELHGRLKSMDVSETKADLARILEGINKDKAQFEKDLEKERYSQLNK